MDDLFTYGFRHASPVDCDAWLEHLFSSKAAVRGQVVRRKASSVERIVGWRRFRSELLRRGYSAVRNGEQVVIFCNTDPIHPV